MKLGLKTAMIPADGAAEPAARCLEDGGLVAFPTETVYGLGADATNARAVARLYGAKGRPSFNPLIAHVSDLQAARQIARFDEEVGFRFEGVPQFLDHAGQVGEQPGFAVQHLVVLKRNHRRLPGERRRIKRRDPDA